jgi:hypothetical protein
MYRQIFDILERFSKNVLFDINDAIMKNPPVPFNKGELICKRRGLTYQLTAMALAGDQGSPFFEGGGGILMSQSILPDRTYH